MARRVQKRHGGLVGGGFFGLAVCQEATHRRIGAAGHRTHAELARRRNAGETSADRRGQAQNLQRHGRRFHLRNLRAQSRQVTAGDMAGLVRDDADHLVRRVRYHERSGMHEHVVAIDDEGVEVLVVDEVDLDVL